MHENLILFCNCEARNERAEWIRAGEVLEVHPEMQYNTLNDLCGICAKEPERIAEVIRNAGKVLLIACYPRAVDLLLQHAGVPDLEKIRHFNLLEEDPGKLDLVIREFADDIKERSRDHELPGVTGDARQPGKTALQGNPSWPAWYPVIDTARCTQCGQCADFCLFGVYRKTAAGVEVVNPENCKNNCPACARICPSVAIVFPKYAGGGAIGGSRRICEKTELKRIQRGTDANLGGGIYQALEQRKMKRRSIIRDESMQQAIHERNEALEQSRAAGEQPGG